MPHQNTPLSCRALLPSSTFTQVVPVRPPHQSPNPCISCYGPPRAPKETPSRSWFVSRQAPHFAQALQCLAGVKSGTQQAAPHPPTMPLYRHISSAQQQQRAARLHTSGGMAPSVEKRRNALNGVSLYAHRRHAMQACRIIYLPPSCGTLTMCSTPCMHVYVCNCCP